VLNSHDFNCICGINVCLNLQKLKEAKSINREKRDRLPLRPQDEVSGSSSTVTITTTATTLKTSAANGDCSVASPAPLSSPPSSTSGGKAVMSAASTSSTSATSTPFKVRTRRYPSPSSSSVYGSGSERRSGDDDRSTVGVHWSLGDCCSTESSSPGESDLSQSPPHSVAEGEAPQTGTAPPLKKRRIDIHQPVAEYPFFGPKCPRTTKLTALQCLEFLDGPNLFAVSLVNRLLNQAAMDDALWE
jgi:hypothetical protein